MSLCLWAEIISFTQHEATALILILGPFAIFKWIYIYQIFNNKEDIYSVKLKEWYFHWNTEVSNRFVVIHNIYYISALGYLFKAVKLSVARKLLYKSVSEMTEIIRIQN